jgi:hypothetical protein
LGRSRNRNEQFENIERVKSEFLERGEPVISMDTKKKELMGEFSRPRDSLYGTEAQVSLDHDFESQATGKAIPHGLYDEKHKRGYITIGTSRETSEFICDNIKKWWLTVGMVLYPLARMLLILCDGGGSNSSRHYIFKEDLVRLASEIGLDIRIAHYPPYCSKWNSIEHKLFPHVSNALRGANFRSVEQLSESIKRTKTKTGLKVDVDINDKVYERGRKVKEDFKETMAIQFDDYLPNWNYTAKAA